MVGLHVFLSGIESGWGNAILQLVGLYAVVTAFVIALTMILSLTTNMSPTEVIKDALSEIGIHFK